MRRGRPPTARDWLIEQVLAVGACAMLAAIGYTGGQVAGLW